MFGGEEKSNVKRNINKSAPPLFATASCFLNNPGFTIGQPTPTRMDSLRLSIDPRTIEHSLQSRKLRSVEQDGSLTYDDP